MACEESPPDKVIIRGTADPDDASNTDNGEERR
jgi:hypothetical protein